MAASSKFFWIPLYLLLLIVLIKKFGSKIYYPILAVVLLILLSDQLSVFIKNKVQRLRPCHNPEMSNMVHMVNNDCGGAFGFVSSHACNSAALATFFILLFGLNNKKVFTISVFYCLIVSYSRIMLGRHYPLDIIGGWLLGALCGFLVFKVFQKITSNQNLNSIN